MKPYETAKLLTVALLIAAPLQVVANGMRLVSQDGFGTARGEAFVATANNPSAVYYNPAGIARLSGDEFRLGIYGIYLDPTFEPPAAAPNSGNTYHIENNLAAAPQFFYTHALEKVPLSLGLGIYAPYGAGVSWPQDTGFRSVATEDSLRISIQSGDCRKARGSFFTRGRCDGGLRRHQARTRPPRHGHAFANNFTFQGDGLAWKQRGLALATPREGFARRNFPQHDVVHDGGPHGVRAATGHSTHPPGRRRPISNFR
jgi:hypothetical protein